MKFETYAQADEIQKRIHHLRETIRNTENWANSTIQNPSNWNSIYIPNVTELYVSNDDFSYLIKSSIERITQEIDALEKQFELL